MMFTYNLYRHTFNNGESWILLMKDVEITVKQAEDQIIQNNKDRDPMYLFYKFEIFHNGKPIETILTANPFLFD